MVRRQEVNHDLIKWQTSNQISLLLLPFLISHRQFAIKIENWVAALQPSSEWKCIQIIVPSNNMYLIEKQVSFIFCLGWVCKGLGKKRVYCNTWSGLFLVCCYHSSNILVYSSLDSNCIHQFKKKRKAKSGISL